MSMATGIAVGIAVASASKGGGGSAPPEVIVIMLVILGLFVGMMTSYDERWDIGRAFYVFAWTFLAPVVVICLAAGLAAIVN